MIARLYSGPTILTIPPDDWVKYARMAETAPQRTIQVMEADYAMMGAVRR